MAFMIVLAYLLGLLFLVSGVGYFIAAKGAIHEIGGLVSLLIGFGLIMSAMIIQRLGTIIKELRAARDPSALNTG